MADKINESLKGLKSTVNDLSKSVDGLAKSANAFFDFIYNKSVASSDMFKKNMGDFSRDFSSNISFAETKVLKFYKTSQKYFKSIDEMRRNIRKSEVSKETSKDVRNIRAAGVNVYGINLRESINAYNMAETESKSAMNNIRLLSQTLADNEKFLSDMQKTAIENQLGYWYDQIDVIKRNSGIPMKYIAQLERSANAAMKSQEEKNKLDSILLGISQGNIKATSEDTKRMIARRNFIESQKSKEESPFISSFRQSFADATLGGAGFGSTAQWIGSGFSDYRKKQAEISDSQAKAQQEFASRRSSIERKLLITQSQLATGKISEETARSRSKKLKGQLGEIDEQSKASALASKQLLSKGTSDYLKLGWKSLMIDLGKKAVKVIMDVYRSAKKMIDDVASYSLSTSYKVNSEAREQALTYGLSDAQNYAFTQVKSLMGITSDEDLYWMNDNQREMFSYLMEKETDFYDRLTESGSLEGIQKMQIDFALMKQEFSTTVAKFFVENKDTIINAAQLGLNALLVIAKVLAGIFDVISAFNIFQWGSSSGNTYNVNLTNNISGSTTTSSEDLANSISNSNLVGLKTYFES